MYPRKRTGTSRSIDCWSNWRNRFLLPSSMVVRLHKKCTYSGLIFSVAFVACACAGYLSKSCSLQVQRLQVALSLTSILYFPWAEPRGPQHKQMNCGLWYTSFCSCAARLSYFIAIWPIGALPAAEDSYHPHIGSFTSKLLQPSVHSSTFFALSNYQLNLAYE